MTTKDVTDSMVIEVAATPTQYSREAASREEVLKIEQDLHLLNTVGLGGSDHLQNRLQCPRALGVTQREVQN